ncbi:MAG TPA: hypothetical protein GXX23_06400 [Firmicutes bacterium]|nr:hypothetical protein [Candidatus Fermentithermobacillaceae bacterium]
MQVSSVNSENTTVVRTVPASKVAKDTNVDPKTMKACQDFEAVFLSFLWGEMSKSAGVDLGGWDVIGQQAIGQKWAQAGGIGLAKVIYERVAKYSPR